MTPRVVELDLLDLVLARFKFWDEVIPLEKCTYMALEATSVIDGMIDLEKKADPLTATFVVAYFAKLLQNDYVDLWDVARHMNKGLIPWGNN